MKVQFAFVLAVALIAGCRTAPPRLASVNGCQQLWVVPAATRPGSVTINSVKCTHGSWENVVVSPTQQEIAVLEQSDAYGPDCQVTFMINATQYVIQAQQDLCGFEAGNVTASVVSGNASITVINKGSYSASTPGSVEVALD